MAHHGEAGRVEIRGGTAMLVVTRTLATRRVDAWEWVTHPERLAQWIGLLEGTPSVGAAVDFTMTAEENAAPETATIRACEPESSYLCEVGTGPGTWLVGCELGGDDGAVTVSITQPVTSAEASGMYGPGWEYYLDRLLAAFSGDAMPDFDDYYPANAAHYEAAYTQAT